MRLPTQIKLLMFMVGNLRFSMRKTMNRVESYKGLTQLPIQQEILLNYLSPFVIQLYNIVKSVLS